MRRAAKVDSNHALIVAAFRAMGCQVERWSQPNAPDLVVSLLGLNHVVEVKTATGKQSPGQVKWAAMWRATVHVVRTVEDVRTLVMRWRGFS